MGRYGRDAVFIDIDNIPVGVDFRDHLRSALVNCDLVIAIIGRDWLHSGGDGARRIDDDADWVRMEIETALQNSIPIIPILVDSARMPQAEALPTSLAPLAYRNAAEVASGREFHVQMDRIIVSIDNILRSGSRGRSIFRKVSISLAGSLAAAMRHLSERSRAALVVLGPVLLGCASGAASILINPIPTVEDAVRGAIKGNDFLSFPGEMPWLGVGLVFSGAFVAILAVWGRASLRTHFTAVVTAFAAWSLAWLTTYIAFATISDATEIMPPILAAFLAGGIGGSIGAVPICLAHPRLRSRRTIIWGGMVGGGLGTTLAFDLVLGWPIVYIAWQGGLLAYVGWRLRTPSATPLASDAATPGVARSEPTSAQLTAHSASHG